MQVLAPFGFAIFRAKPVEGAKIVDVLRLEIWVEHLRKGHLTNLLTEQEALRHPRLYTVYHAMEEAIATFSDFPITELVSTGEEFLQRLKEKGQQEQLEIEKTERALTDEELESLGEELIAATLKNDLLNVKELLKKGASVEARDNNGRTALAIAVMKDFTNLTQTLLATGANIEARDNNGNTALMYAANGGDLNAVGLAGSNLDALRSLLAARADIETRNNDGNTALMYAVSVGDLDAVRSLLAAGADIETRNNNNNEETILINAVLWGHVDVVQALLAAGADRDAQRRNGETALDIAKGFSDQYSKKQALIEALEAV